ncbi:MAG: glucoamylase family protein [Candidatus Acidiferrales bacterium]
MAADQQPGERNPVLPPRTFLTESDDYFLEDVEKANFLYFWEQCNPTTGLVKDRSNVRASDKHELGSIAATGFGLTALCIGENRGYVSAAEARSRVLASLRFLWKKLHQHRGFFYHWASINTGERLWQSEVSSVDTAILLCGILTCKAHFQHSEISQLATDIFNRVDWNWLSEDTPILPHGWTPETGFLQYRWDNYSEMMMIYLLGLGSTTHPLPANTWDAWKRTTFDFDGIQYIGSFAPLFIHQYSQAWFDFRGKRDRYADYFQNSILATDVHRRFCLSLSHQFPDYSEDLWGITASDSETGYKVWGGPPSTGPIDGTVVPCASAGSLPFLPQAAMRVLRTIRTHYGTGTWCRYGFVDAFNPLKNWYDSDVIGIDAGIMMVMLENARTAFVWDTFMKNPEAQRGMERAGFKFYQPAGD